MKRWTLFTGLLLALLLIGNACGGGSSAVNPQTPDGDADLDSAESDVESEPLCTDDDSKCLKNDVMTCKKGAWSFYRSCVDDGKVCLNGECTLPADGDSDAESLPVGTPCTQLGARNCDGITVMRCSQDTATGNLTWVKYVDCDSKTDECKDGACRTKATDSCTVADGCKGENEYCLPSKAGGDSGVCMPSCALSGVHCPAGYACQASECKPIKGYCTSNAQCGLDQFCNKAGGRDDGLCLTFCDRDGQACQELYRCENDTTNVNYGRCVPTDTSCTICDSSPNACGSSSYCELVTGQLKGCCHKKCSPSDSSACVSPLTCGPEGRCVAGGSGDCGGPCPIGYVCDKTFNTCVLNCGTCPADQCCDAGSAPKCYGCVCKNPLVCGLLMPPCCAGFHCSTLIYGLEGYCAQQ